MNAIDVFSMLGFMVLVVIGVLLLWHSFVLVYDFKDSFKRSGYKDWPKLLLALAGAVVGGQILLSLAFYLL